MQDTINTVDESYLMTPRVSRVLTIQEVSEVATRAIGMHRKMALHYEQAIHCCSVTAIAHGLSSLSDQAQLSVDDLFHRLRIPVSFVVDRGLTLAQAFDLVVRAIHTLPNLGSDRYFVESYFMDDHVATLTGFQQSITESLNLDHEVLIANFDLCTAHGGSEYRDWGGHFGLMGGLSEAGDVIMCDTSNEFGRWWQTTSKMLFKAMVHHDSASGRSRGFIRIAKQGSVRPLPGLASSCTSVDWNNPTQPLLPRFIPSDHSHFTKSRNITGVSAAALALTALGLSCQHDDIIQDTGQSVEYILKNTLSAGYLCNMSSHYVSQHAPLHYIIRALAIPIDTSELLWQFLRYHSHRDSIVALHFDFNVAHHGANIKPRRDDDSSGPAEWYIVAMIDKEEVVIADTHSITASRLWRCTMHRLFNAVLASNERRLVVFQRQS